MLKKVCEMEKEAYRDYVESGAYNGEESQRTQELRYRWLGILEVKREIMRMAD